MSNQTIAMLDLGNALMILSLATREIDLKSSRCLKQLVISVRGHLGSCLVSSEGLFY